MSQIYDIQTEPEEGERNLTPWYAHARLEKPTTTFKQEVGDRPEYLNLRDHDELNDQKIAVVNYLLMTGDYGEYVLIGVWLLDPNEKPIKPVVLMTGAADVMGRVMAVDQTLKEGTPVVGTLRKVGRAWVLD